MTGGLVPVEGGPPVVVAHVPQPGQVDLCVTRRALVKDLAILAGDFTVAGVNFLPGDAVTLLAGEEACGLPEATRRLLERMRQAQAAGPVKWLFWLEDGNWKQAAAFSIGIEDEQ